MAKSKIQATAEQILGRELEVHEGIPENEILHIEKALGFRLPKALRDFYQSIGNIELFVNGIDMFCMLNELRIRDNKLVFLDGSSAIFSWAFSVNDCDKENIKVYRSPNIDDDVVDWFNEELTLEDFIVQHLFYQTMMGDPKYHNEVEGGFKYIIGLDNMDFVLSAKAKEFINDIEINWPPVCKDSAMSFYQKGEEILARLSSINGNVVSMILFASRNKKVCDFMMEEYGFFEI